MNGITVTEAQAQLDCWLAASRAVSQGQAYTIATESSSRTLTRADAKTIQEQIVFWDRQVKRLSRGGLHVGFMTAEEEK